jgi:hypothetical protein
VAAAKLLTGVAAACALSCFGTAADAGESSSTIEASAPAGFDALARPREVVTDVYFAGRKVGEATGTARPGFLTFNDPSAVAALVPDAADPAAIAAALAGNLPTNSNLVCSDGESSGCGELMPATAGIIFDEDRFRVDLFVAPRLLRLITPDEQVYLPTPTASLSVTSSMGLALSGATGARAAYNIQNRTIVGFHNAHIRSDSSYSSHFGLLFDDLVAEVDRPDLRYSAGLFWAPGIDLIGERRIVGAGVGSQFDTRANHESVEGTPIILFLSQAARVDILVDGRLVESRAYQAGNNVLDTSGLPDGSYGIVLQIHEAGGRVREERRFFARSAGIPPVGQPLYYAYAGLLANSRQSAPISLSDTFYYQLGAARRLSPSFAVDASILGTQERAMAELGSWFLSPVLRSRAAALLSTKGDAGVLLQVQSAELHGLVFNFDLRRIWSHDGRPLIPLPTMIGSFQNAPPTQSQLGGSFTQASGSVGYHLGTASLLVVGSYRKDEGIGSDYVIGPQFSWPVVHSHGLQLTLEANAQRTRTTAAGFVGVRILSVRGPVSMVGSAGYSAQSSSDGSFPSERRAVGSLSADYSYEGSDRTQASIGAGVDRGLEATVGRVGGFVYSRLGSVHGDVQHDFEGRGGTQYGVTVQTGLAAEPRSIVVGGRDIDESAVIVSVDGRVDSPFEVLVDDTPRGRVSSGGRLPLFLQPYHSYRVRLRPLNAAGVSYDSAAREVSLYPGNVQHLDWHVERLFTLFGQAIRADGRPLADAMIQARHGIGESDANGYFQIDAGAGEAIRFTDASGGSCSVTVREARPVNDFVAIGKVVCR